jgi:CubicO group peptidase (beta-lactamase class C family)
MEEIDTLVRAVAGSGGLGIAVAVAQDGALRHSAGYGLADREWGLPVTPQTVFGLGSVTKPFTAQAIMLLERDGRLTLDAPLRAYLTDYRGPGQDVTLAQLLTHTSGIPNYVMRPGFWEEVAPREHSPKELCALFQGLPLDFAPGSQYRYSNSGYHLLGMIIEVLAGMDYEAFLRARIFAPLGMRDTRLLRHDAIIARRARGYQPADDGSMRNARYFDWSAAVANGGLGSTLDDLALWDAALRKGQPLDAVAQARMEAPLRLASGRTEGYGLGWGLSTYRGQPLAHHAGGVPGYSTFVGRFAARATTLIVLTNRSGFDAASLARQIAYLVGTYVGEFGFARLAVSRTAGGGLAVRGEIDGALVPCGAMRFRWGGDRDVELRFEDTNMQGHFQRVSVVKPFYWYAAFRDAAASGE